MTNVPFCPIVESLINERIHLLVTHPKEVPVGIVIEPVMYYHVPGPVVVSIGCGIPPVLKAQLKDYKSDYKTF